MPNLEERIAALPGEKVTENYIKTRISKVEYFVLPGTTVTICSITIDNGYSVRGESACVDPINYNKEIGEELAYKQAFENLWPLFGFLLAETICRYNKAVETKEIKPSFQGSWDVTD